MRVTRWSLTSSKVLVSEFHHATSAVAAIAALLLVITGCADAPTAPVAPTDSCIGSGCTLTLAPTTTSTAAATTPPVPVQGYSGSGSDVVDFTTPVQFGVLRFDCPKCSGNVILKSDAAIDNALVNRIGRYSGTRWIGARGDTTSRVQITARGDWKLTVGGFDLARMVEVTEPIKGTGDDVVLYRVLPQTVTATHDGNSNFIVQEATDGMTVPDLAINEIGSYTGTVMFPGNGSNAGLVQVTADGAWTLTPKL
jgi:hypothetical protein